MELGLYTLDWEAVGDAGTIRAFDALLDVHAESLERAYVDAVTAEPELPEPVAQALDELAALAESQAATRLPNRSLARRLFPSIGDDPLVAVELDLRVPAQLEILRRFALFSTAAVILLTGDDQPEIEVRDMGKELTFFGDEDFVTELAAQARIPLHGISRVD